MAASIDFFPIQVEQTDWQTSHAILAKIRAEVFIAEQDVPEEEEYDELDPTATHWIAWGENQTPMGVARLAGNRIGRMAVLKPYRSKGVGSAILRTIIAFAVRTRLNRLVLDAQLHAVGFYENNGFTVAGDEFLEVGIAHVPMAMELQRFIHRRPEPSPPDISEEQRHRHPVEGKQEYQWAALQVARHSERYIRIFSEELSPEFFDNEELCRAIFTLVTNHPNAKVMILVKNTDGISRRHHRLVETFHRLSSHIELRKLTREIETSHQEFMTGDVQAVLYNQNPRKSTGYLCLYSPLEAKHLNDDFDVLWNHSEPDPQIRQLHI